jgi:hypothetical protein
MAFSAFSDRKPAFDPRVLRDVEQAALFLIEKIECDGWKVWSWNYLREHARCKSGARFTNSDSPELYRALRQRNPELAKRIARVERMQAGQGDMF